MSIWESLNPFQASEEKILANKKAGLIYVADFSNGEGKYISTVIDDDTDSYDISLRVSPRVEVRITYITNDDKITGVQISKLSGKKIEKMNLSTLSFKGILGILHIFSGLDLKSITNRSLILDSGIVNNEDELRTHINTILADEKGLKMIAELAKAKGIITEGDIGDISNKIEAIKTFQDLLNNEDFFNQKKAEWGKTKDEDVWQSFFENNKWIFGYGLEYVFNAPISSEKFQQTLKGSNFLESGKRPDGILKSLGFIQFLNIVEIKTHKTPLLDSGMYRSSGIWRISDGLAGAISQCQQYIRESARNFDELFELKDKEGNRTNEEIVNFHPKCFLIAGDTRREFMKEGKVSNSNKLSCFEHFRKNILTPEIITFDQLYFRAKHIIEYNS